MGIKTLNENILQHDSESNNNRGNLDINYISDDDKKPSSKTQGFKRDCYSGSNKDSIEEIAKSDGLQIKNNFSTKQNKMCNSNDSQVVFDSHVYSLNIECGELNKNEDVDTNIINNVKNEFKGQVIESKSI